MSKNRELARALEAIDLHDMARLARDGHYSDFGSYLPFPKMTLSSELQAKGTAGALDLRQRVIDGEFDDDDD